MKELKDPPRLLDPQSDAPDALRELLEAGRADLPDAAQLARLASRLPVGTPGAPPANGAPPSPPAPLAAPAAPSVLSGALIGGALAIVVVGAVWVREAMTAREPAPTPVIAATSSTASPRVNDVPQPIPPAPTPVPSSARASEPTPPVAARPSVSSSAPPPTESAAPVDSETEVQLLQRAQDALRRSPADALVVTDEHQRRFPGGALGQEREILAINALAALGRTADARARAERFLAAHPGSAYRSRLEALVPGLSSP